MMRSLFNTAMESSIRSLLLLTEIKESVDLDLLVIYDYFLVHSGDYPNGPRSLHPPVPHRSGELLVRRDLVRAGVDYALSKSLTERCYTQDGVEYRATDIAPIFLSYFASHYFKALRERAQWVSSKVHTIPKTELDRLIADNLESWGADTAKFLLVPHE